MPRCTSVQDAISAEPERDWDMAALAAIGHVTERHLLRLFMEHAGVSPMQCLQAIRLERARQSLEHGASVTRRGRSRGLPLEPATAARVEPAVGRLAARCSGPSRAWVDGDEIHAGSARGRGARRAAEAHDGQRPVRPAPERLSIAPTSRPRSRLP